MRGPGTYRPRQTFSALASILLVAATAPAFAQGIVAFEFLEKRIRSADSVAPLGDSVFGDKVSLYNGATEFEVFDIDLVGNNALPVRLGRTWKLMPQPQYLNSNGTSSQVTPLGGFGSWDLNVPYIYGTFDMQFGWNAAGTPNRCSTAAIARTTDNVNPRDILSGRQLHIPGEGDTDLLLLSTTHPRPNDGHNYVWGTKSDYRGRCIQLANGQGEGFEFVDPNGTVYRFDVFATRDGGVVEKGSPTGPVSAHRQVIYLMASKVTDRHGNYVNYHYVGNGELDRIESSDGRLITTTRSGGRINTATAGSRTWRYHYGTTFEVENPDQTRWRYEAQGSTVPQISTTHDAVVCDYPIINDPGLYVLTITAPSGLKGKFSFAYVSHLISGTPANGFCIIEYWADWPNPPQPVAMIGTPDFFSNYALFEKEFSGPGMAAQAWTYEYGMPETGKANFSGAYCTYCDIDKPVTVRQPDGTSVVHQFGALWGFNTGELLSKYTLDQHGTIVKSEVYEHVTDQEMGSMPFPNSFLGGSSDDWAVYLIRPVKLSTVSVGANIPGHPPYVPPPAPPSPQPPPPCYGEGCPPPPEPCEPNPVTGACDAPMIVHEPAEGGDSTPSSATASSSAQTTGGVAVTTFTREVTTFDVFARPISEYKWSSLGYGKTDTTEYHDNLGKWAIGQVRRTTTNGIEAARTDYDANALPWKTYRFGKLQQTLGYWADGTLATVTDGRGNTTGLHWWKRGIPREIHHPDGTVQSASVDDNGWIRSVTDANGYTTGYDYDPMGRMKRIDYPTGDSTAWNSMHLSFAPSASPVYGLPAGHWRQTISTGNARTVTFFDALWRPVVKETYDATNIPDTLAQTITRYDANGRPVFASYPQRTLDPAVYNTWANPAQAPNALGTRTFYDALDRVTRVEQDSELGVLATTTAYLDPFKTETTNPRGFTTRMSYVAYDQPTYDMPNGILEYAGRATSIYRDVFGKPTALHRYWNGLASWRYYVYDGHQQLCKTIEPETGSTVMAYDNAGNLAWSATGHVLPDTATCNHAEGYGWGRRVDRSYDTRNRLTTLSFPDGNGNQTWTYTADGLPASITTANDGGATSVINAYSYNRRRLMTGESASQPGWYTWGIGYTYDGNGHLAGQSYPTGLHIDYAPNALGQATRAGTYATGVRYHPNGSIAQFSYGNGVVHSMAQNARQLPAQVVSTGVSHYQYVYDGNANVQYIYDWANPALHRYLYYDGLDRLTDAGSQAFGGDHWHRFTYDALDNLKSWKLGGVKDHAEYLYDPSNRLTNIRNSAGATIVGLGYDVQGNLANKNGQTYTFDFGNRLRGVPGNETYRYDGHGRRVQNIKADGRLHLWQYGQNGQLLFGWTGPSNQTTHEYVYLGGSLVATIDHAWPSNAVTATKYQHTDALGSPVAVTNEAGQVIDRTQWEPYGAAIGKPAYDGIGYTGHVMDGATGLTYMQQRYYDPESGRFLSVDPVTANSGTGANFNRYWYASNNPYRFIDPDGRRAKEAFREMVEGGSGAGGAGSSVASASSAQGSSASKSGMAERKAIAREQTQPFTGGQPDKYEVGPTLACFTGRDCSLASAHDLMKQNSLPFSLGLGTPSEGQHNLLFGTQPVLHSRPAPFITINDALDGHWFKGRVIHLTFEHQGAVFFYTRGLGDRGGIVGSINSFIGIVPGFGRLHTNMQEQLNPGGR